LNRKGRSLRNGARIGLACIELKGKNKSQQRSNNSGREGLVTTQRISTEINKNQQSQQKSAKVSRNRRRYPGQSAKVSKNHHKSSEIITGLGPWGWFVNRLQFFFVQNSAIGT